MIATVNGIQKPPLTDDLAHYGVKGMKWGVRRTDAQLRSSRKRVRDSFKEGSKKATADVKSGKTGGYKGDQSLSARKNVLAVNKEARSAIKEYKKATTTEGRQAAAKKYNDVAVKAVKTASYQKDFKRATTPTAGRLVVDTILSGPYAPITLAIGLSNRKNANARVQKHVRATIRTGQELTKNA